nr:uncharacterized protein LOC129264624 isoform X1 [Lytechinus pictus]
MSSKMMEDDEYGSRRPRSRNWNTAEKFFLFEHVKNRFDIITDPRKETASINAKRRVWEQIYQAIAKEFGPLEEHLVRGKGGEKCRTQWKNLVQAARKEYKQYMEAKMVGKRHNMTLLSRKICRLMSIDLDDGLGDQDNEENDWTEDHPEFRYQPELCQELKETARRINEEYQQGVYDNTLAMEDNPGDYEEEGSFEGEMRSDSETELPDDEKDEDYAPSARKTPRKRGRRSSSGRSSGKTPTRTSARAQAAQAKKVEQEKKARKRKAEQQEEVYQTSNYQMAAGGNALTDAIQQEILNLHIIEHKKRMNLLNTEHKTKMQNLKTERDIMALQKEYWVKKIELLYDSKSGKGRAVDDEGDEDEDEGLDDDEDDGNEMDTAAPGPSGTSAPTSVVVPPPTQAAVPDPLPESIAPVAPPPAEVAHPPPSVNTSAPHYAVSPHMNQENIQERPTNGAMGAPIPRQGPPEGYHGVPNQDMVNPNQQPQ